MEEIIKVENLCFEYEPGLQTISNISFQIHKGEYVAILDIMVVVKVQLLNYL